MAFRGHSCSGNMPLGSKEVQLFLIKSMRVANTVFLLMFDEISLSSKLSYDRKKDHIVGFVELANGRKSLFANHTLVFMIKGIKDRWKQPVAFYFSEGGVGAKVCDQYAANCKAVNMLLNDTEEYYKTKNLHWNKLFFEIDGHEIVPLYDPPHLLKCLDGDEYEASWKDIIDYYNYDSTSSMFRRCPTLTEHHLDQTKMKRVKVSLAAQVFSQRVAHGLQNSGYQVVAGSVTSYGTGEFLMFMDYLFDSVNGLSKLPLNAKLVLNSMQFIKSKGLVKVLTKPPCIKNWIRTIEGLSYIWQKLKVVQGLSYLCTRNFNQDPLENFFCCIRSHGASNTNPSCYSFVSAFRTLLVNNLSSRHSPSANCEIDDITGLFATFRVFLNNEDVLETDSLINMSIEPFHFQDMSLYSKTANAYVAGYCTKKLLGYVGECHVCTSELLADPIGRDEVSWIASRDYTGHSLLVPGNEFLIKKGELTATMERGLLRNLKNLFSGEFKSATIGLKGTLVL
ncbi:uncharacterized protein LOC113375753 [Ctenocephalides felis]|uniref:uncharacterized protein LOC113375753 n=1 Tax=Ctenocephalides felis TaxID=7515 RepID=UPI000E6E234F|nr:uncharacterized protein LOC113375753 [Ctenocephalides felis]